MDRYVSGRRSVPVPVPTTLGTGGTTRTQRAEWGRQGSGNRDGDEGVEGVEGPRWTRGERDRMLRREVLRMQIESLPAGGL